MKNYVQPGHKMAYTNAGSAISSGDVVSLGNRIAIADTDIAATTGVGTVSLEGVYSLPAETDTAFAQGDALYWSSGELTKTAAGGVYAGIAHEDKLQASAVGYVRLQPHPKVMAKVADASSGSAAEINALRDAMIAAGLMSNT